MASSDTRTPIHRAVGLGSAKSGSAHWWSQRITAAALVPLMLWLTGSLISLAGRDYHAFIGWLHNPITVVLLSLLLIALFRHTVLGLEVIAEDYIHACGLKIITIGLLRFAGVILAASGIFAMLVIAFGGY